MRKRLKKKTFNKPTNTFSTCIHTDIASGILVDFDARTIVLVDEYAYTFQELYDAVSALWEKVGKGSCPLLHSRYTYLYNRTFNVQTINYKSCNKRME